VRRITSIVFLLFSLPIIPSQAKSQTQATDPADIEAIKQVELDLGNFQISGISISTVTSMLTISQSLRLPAT
jgi:hypothetical protein